MNKETGGSARQFLLGVVQSAERLPVMHVHPGDLAETETETLQSMLEKELRRFDVQRVILVADRGLLSLDNVAEIQRTAEAASRRLEFILAVPARRYAELGATIEGLAFKDGLAEGQFAAHRLVVAHDPARAAEQGARRKEQIADVVETLRGNISRSAQTCIDNPAFAARAWYAYSGSSPEPLMDAIVRDTCPRLVAPLVRDSSRWRRMWAEFEARGMSAVDAEGFAELYA